MLRKAIIAANFIFLAYATILSNDVTGLYPCFIVNDNLSITQIPEQYCQTERHLVNCDASQPGYETLYYNFNPLNSPKPYELNGINTQGFIQGAGAQPIAIPNSVGDYNAVAYTYVANFSNVNMPPLTRANYMNWKHSSNYGDVVLSSKKDRLYVSTKTVDNSGNIYVSTTGCPMASVTPSKQVEVFNQQSAAKAMTRKMQSYKR